MDTLDRHALVVGLLQRRDGELSVRMFKPDISREPRKRLAGEIKDLIAEYKLCASIAADIDIDGTVKVDHIA
ncbi:MAG: hypothetical protein DLM59_10845 [Pseudonocardiales bacterium]|nr:MAG: hypothetical protein DLM59_10845 [Pseudonocardiales bacterium]